MCPWSGMQAPGDCLNLHRRQSLSAAHPDWLVAQRVAAHLRPEWVLFRVTLNLTVWIQSVGGGAGCREAGGGALRRELAECLTGDPWILAELSRGLPRAGLWKQVSRSPGGWEESAPALLDAHDFCRPLWIQCASGEGVPLMSRSNQACCCLVSAL